MFASLKRKTGSESDSYGEMIVASPGTRCTPLTRSKRARCLMVRLIVFTHTFVRHTQIRPRRPNQFASWLHDDVRNVEIYGKPAGPINRNPGRLGTRKRTTQYLNTVHLP